jgi:PAS domain S-box-containing protein
VAGDLDRPEAADLVAARIDLASATLAGLVMVAAGTALAGWVGDSQRALRSLFPGFAPIEISTALSLLLSAGALFAYRAPISWHARARVLRYLIWTTTALVALAFLDYASGLPIGLERWLIPGAPGSPAAANPTMSMATGAGLLLCNAALLLAERGTRYGPAQAVIGASAFLAALNIVCFLFDDTMSMGLAVYLAVPVHTAACLLLLSLAFLFARPDEGLMKSVVDPGPAGMLVRHFLPVVFVLPVLLAWPAWLGARAGWYAPAFAIALFVSFTILVMSVSVWAGSQLLRRFEDQRMSAERERQQSEERLRRAIAEAPVPMMIHDDADQILHLSRGWADASGYTRDDTPTLAAWTARAQGHARFEVKAYLARVATATDTVHGGESLIRTKSGDQRIWDFSTTPLGSLTGEPRTFVTMAVDVTDRKKAEAELRRTNENLELRIAERTAELTTANDALRRQSDQMREQAALLDLVKDGILVRDLYGTIVYWSAGAEDLFGYPRVQALGAVSHQLLRPTYPRPLAEIEQQVIESGSWEGEVRLTTRSGLTITVESRWTLTRTDSGVPQGFLEINRDLTARQRTEASLRDSELRFRAVAETANAGIALADGHGILQYWNPAAERIFGRTAAEMVGQSVLSIVPERHRAAHDAGMKHFLATGEASIIGRSVEYAGLRKDGTEFPLEMSLSSWQTSGGPFFSAILRDITQRKRTEQALEAKADELSRSNQELEQFAYIASHDLQEPLRMVSNYTELIAKRYKDRLDADGHEFIEFAVDGAKRMQALIRDLLQYARVGTRGKEFRATAGDAIVHDAVANLASAIEESRAEIRTDPLPTLVCDASQLGQVFQNLIGNAIKFQRPGVPPVVSVSARRDGDATTIAVADNGIGIDSKHFERIFQMFQRLHLRDEYEGTGIGLALCRKIVQRHGGRIRLESTPGRGTTFFVTLPDTPPQIAAGAPLS